MTPRRCVLHIGMDKTSSTAIQQRLGTYSGTEAGFLHLGTPTQTETVLVAAHPSPPGRFLPAGADRAALRAAARSRIERAIDTAPPTFVISSEFPSGRMPAEARVALLELLGDRVARLDVIVYVREPVSYLGSVLQERLKARPVQSNPSRLRPGYRARLEPWEEAMQGRGSLTYVEFAPRAFTGGDLIVDFARRAGLPEVIATRRRGTANVGLSADAVAALAAYRAVEGPAPATGPAGRAESLLIHALKSSGGGRLGFRPRRVAAILAEHRADLDWMEERIGGPFEKAVPPADRLIGSVADLERMAAGLEVALAEWQERVAPEARPAGPDAAAVLRAVRDVFLARETTKEAT